MIKIGIIGQGFVGGTCYEAFSKLEGYEVFAYDKDPERSKSSFEEVVECDVIFVAVPTPMDSVTGECHTNIVDKVITQIRAKNKDSYIVIKSTVPPGTTERLNFSYDKIAFSPEFLTEADAYNDFVNLPYQIIGYSEESQIDDSGFQLIGNIFIDAHRQGVMRSKRIHSISARAAEMVKYTRNTYLATRLSFFNEIKQICDKLKISYDQLRYYAGLDGRVGNHYNEVKKGDEGWGKSCLPKDINALIFKAKELKIKPMVLEAVWEKNLEVIPEDKKDWEQMPGRAVIKKEDSDPTPDK